MDVGPGWWTIKKDELRELWNEATHYSSSPPLPVGMKVIFWFLVLLLILWCF